MKRYIEAIKENFDEIVEAMIALDRKYYKYQVDLYLYPDGETYEFINVGGNSWLDDEHIVVWSVNHEFDDEPTEEEYDDLLPDTREYMIAMLDNKLEDIRQRAAYEEELAKYGW